MTNERFEVTKYKDHPEWDRINIKQTSSEWCIDGCKDGDVEFSCHPHESGTCSLFLNQDELKQVIEFLQEKTNIRR